MEPQRVGYNNYMTDCFESECWQSLAVAGATVLFLGFFLMLSFIRLVQQQKQLTQLRREKESGTVPFALSYNSPMSQGLETPRPPTEDQTKSNEPGAA